MKQTKKKMSKGKKTAVILLCTLAPATAIAVPTAVILTRDSTQTLGYDDAREWVKNNYGETSTFVKPTKETTIASFSGKITEKGRSDYETILKADGGYWPNHVASMLEQMGYFNKGDFDIKTYYTHEQDTTTFNLSGFNKDNTVDFTAENFFAPMSLATFDSIMTTYFAGIESKRSTSFIVEGKKIKFVGTFKSYTNGTDGINIMTMPDFSISFDENGRLAEMVFNFAKNAEAEYIWYSTKYASYSDWFDLWFDEGGTIKNTYIY